LHATRRFSDVRRDAPRLVAGEQVRRRSAQYRASGARRSRPAFLIIVDPPASSSK